MRFPQGTVLEPGAYTAVFCSGLDTSAEGQVHSNFKLSADGGYSVTLSRPDGTIIDRVYVTQQYEDITFGRPASGSGATTSPSTPRSHATTARRSSAGAAAGLLGRRRRVCDRRRADR